MNNFSDLLEFTNEPLQVETLQAMAQDSPQASVLRELAEEAISSSVHDLRFEKFDRHATNASVFGSLGSFLELASIRQLRVYFGKIHFQSIDDMQTAASIMARFCENQAFGLRAMAQNRLSEAQSYLSIANNIWQKLPDRLKNHAFSRVKAV